MSSQMSAAAGWSGNRLLSFGSGFKSYYDAPECGHHHNAGILLVWDAENWTASHAESATSKQ